LLSAGHERAIWIDADVLIFAPQTFSIDTTAELRVLR
jgi:hypothetical protein